MCRYSGPVLYSHLLKLASEKAGDGAADLWVPDLNLPVADMLPADYVQSEAVRLEIYGRVARCRNEDDLEDLEEETARRFGRLPPAARDFFAVAKLRLDCKRQRYREARRRAGGRCGDVPAWATAQIQDRSRWSAMAIAWSIPVKGVEDPFERVEEFLEILDE